MSHKTLITGFPRMGEHRELKKALESYWSGKTPVENLQQTAADLRKKHWKLQHDKGIDFISSNDFSYYDIMLDTAIMLNAIPKRFKHITEKEKLYFAMARGVTEAPAMEMTKWFNTNYHYIVPELENGMEFSLNAEKIISEYIEALEIGIETKINLIGPITFLALSKTENDSDPMELMEKILPVYEDLFREISKLSPSSIFVQVDEPIFVKDQDQRFLNQIAPVYNNLSSISDNVKIIISTYFEHAVEAAEVLAKIPVWGIALDFIHGRRNLEILSKIKGKKLIAGVVNGRNIWKNNYDDSLSLLNLISSVFPKEDIIVSTSCSLLHSPFSLRNEPESPVKQWLSFAEEKLEEVVFLGKYLHSEQASSALKNKREENRLIHQSRSESPLIYRPQIQKKIESTEKKEREGCFSERIDIQKEILNLPSLATTTIGSFPQTLELRKIRRSYKIEEISRKQYTEKIQNYIKQCINFQEEIGLDVLVHGEPERNDMVEFFGEKLEGFHFTSNGWVQSYGSRCVKPPVIYGDVERTKPMTVDFISYAQSLTEKPVKGMLTGPATIINWSFIRDDIPVTQVASQIAVALSEEIQDLQDAGIKIIQVDEAAFKEGYPLRKENIATYEKWSVDSFKWAVSSARKETQIHTHMCYSQFNDIIKTLEKMDADVITIETARSGNKLLKVFSETGYSNEIGPGVYDIHSPRIPSVEEFEKQIKQRLEKVDTDKMWINPDCGLKTRNWEEVKPALINMVKATQKIRV